jgi:hypothetical protein
LTARSATQPRSGGDVATNSAEVTSDPFVSVERDGAIEGCLEPHRPRLIVVRGYADEVGLDGVGPSCSSGVSSHSWYSARVIGRAASRTMRASMSDGGVASSRTQEP